MTTLAKYGLVALAALVVGVLLQRDRDAKAAVRTEIVRLDHVRDSLIPVYRADTIRLAASEVRYGRLRDSLLAHPAPGRLPPLTDTVRVKEFIFAADSTINACTAALHDCDRIRLVNDSLVTAYKKLAPKFTDRLGVTVGPALCVAASMVKPCLALGATIKVWP